jgi:transcriptional regulator with XRE-family HTH domain
MSEQLAEDWFGPESATFGDRLAAARESTGMAQAELAKRLGVKKSTIAAWEQDLSEPRANRLSMLSGLLNVSISWMLTGEGEGVNEPADEAEISADVMALLVEIRDIKSQMVRSADRLGRVEKRLRAAVSEAVE